jgi:hypothetical protein
MFHSHQSYSEVNGKVHHRTGHEVPEQQQNCSYGQHYMPAAWPLGKRPSTLLYRRLGKAQSQSRQVQNISPPLGFDPWTVQPIPSHCTNYTIPAHVSHRICQINYLWKQCDGRFLVPGIFVRCSSHGNAAKLSINVHVLGVCVSDELFRHEELQTSSWNEFCALCLSFEALTVMSVKTVMLWCVAACFIHMWQWRCRQQVSPQYWCLSSSDNMMSHPRTPWY